jgi:hypothetical protein
MWTMLWWDQLGLTPNLWDFKFSRRSVWCSELSSGMYYRVKWLLTDISEVRTASIIIPEDNSEHQTPNLSTRELWQPPVLSGSPVRRDISEASTRMDKGDGNLVYPSPWDFKISLTCCKILRHRSFGFISHPKEGVLPIFIALKNSSRWLGSNPLPLGPVASTLTTTPPRQLWLTQHSLFSSPSLSFPN